MLTGVVEVGLFCHMAKAVYFGNEVSAATPSSDGVAQHALYRTVLSLRNSTTATSSITTSRRRRRARCRQQVQHLLIPHCSINC